MRQFSVEEARRALDALDPGVPRSEWIRIGMAAKDAGLSEEDWVQWSSRATNNFAGEKDCQQQWRAIRPGETTAGTLFHLARERGWKSDAELDQEQRERFPQSSRSAPPPARAAAEPREDPDEEAKRSKRRQRLAKLLGVATPADELHPYLVRKGVDGKGLRMVRLQELIGILQYHPEGKAGKLAGDEILLAPFHDGTGAPGQVEMIDADGRKLAIALPRAGLMWSDGPVDRTAATLGLCEGIATAKTLQALRGHQVISSGTANNLPSVAERLRELNPGAEIIVYADLGKDGQRYADEAAALVNGFTVSPPESAFAEPDGADFNDLYEVWGEQEVRDYLDERSVHPQRITFAQAEVIIPIDYALPSLPIGSLGLLVGPGSVGKSFISLELAISVTLGHNFMGAPGLFDELIPGRTAIVFGEDDRAIVNNRMHNMADVFRLRPEDKEQLDRDMLVLSLVGEDMRVAEVDHRSVREGPFIHRLRGICAGRRLVFIDPLIRLHDADENDNTAASHLMLSIQRIARDTSCAIVLLHHVGKGQTDGWAAARGASAITTSARWQLNATPPSRDERENMGLSDDDARAWVKVDGVKMNYGENVRHFWLRRGAHGILRHADPAIVTSGGATDRGSSGMSDPFATGARLGSPTSQLPRGVRR